MIKIENVTKIYKDHDEDIIAIDNISLEFENTGLVVIVGSSGCGKSTLLNILATLDMPNEGNIYIDDVNISKCSKKTLSKIRKSKISTVFQENNLLDNFSVKDNIYIIKNTEIIDDIEKLQIAGLLDKKASKISGGEAQRCAIARCLSKDTQYIFADEPTGSVDQENANIIFQMLKEISLNKLVIVVTHDIESANLYGDRIIELECGKVINDKVISNKNKETNNVNNNNENKISFLSRIRFCIKSLLSKTFLLVLSTIFIVSAIMGINLFYELFTMDNCTIVLNECYDKSQSYLLYSNRTSLPDEEVYDSITI